MTKKHIGTALLYLGAAATAAAVAKMLSGKVAAFAKVPAIPTSNNGANAAIGVGLALVGFYLKK